MQVQNKKYLTMEQAVELIFRTSPIRNMQALEKAVQLFCRLTCGDLKMQTPAYAKRIEALRNGNRREPPLVIFKCTGNGGYRTSVVNKVERLCLCHCCFYLKFRYTGSCFMLVEDYLKHNHESFNAQVGLYEVPESLDMFGEYWNI